MPSQATCRTVSPDIGTAIAAQKSLIAKIEKQLWAGGLNAALLASYQAAFRELEALIAAQGEDGRHKFVIVIAVADRPQHLKSCLDSLLELCRTFGYGGRDDGCYRKVAVLIADDSVDAANISGNRELAQRFSELGLATTCFGPDEQLALLGALDAAGQANLSRVLGALPAGGLSVASFGHKGQAVMRNIAALKLATMAQDERVLFYAVDSDQEFKVKVGTPQGDQDVCAVNFLYRLDEIFAATDALVLTGKVVGDPPVSPAVMTGNFLEDVVGFLRQAAAGADAAGACRHHDADARREGEAAYHDMADLFGFQAAGAAYRYRCTLHGAHSEADCFDHFSARLNGFFYGEHPTRVSYYVHDVIMATVQPARTVYVGNYVIRPAALKYFIPFAALRLRMSGPTLGRLVKSEIGGRFVSANLPMLHKRTVTGTGQSEFRPGIEAAARTIELCGEFERQFYGDVMLFSMEQLAAAGFPHQPPAGDAIAATLDRVRDDMLDKYNAKQRDIIAKLAQLESILHEPSHWWNRSDRHAAAVGNFRNFAANVAHNFGAASACYCRINAAANWAPWRAKLIDAATRYPQDRRAWEATLAAARRAAAAPPQHAS
ncbi:MAG: hypothetical protein PHY45_12095 [Rhodocyclaceae bacterium]|nr:hypothetical protein [Rhodocyclaceae bacterium]